MRIYCCQLDIAWEDKPRNHARARALIEAASPVPGALVVLPEMFATGFSMNVPHVQEGALFETEAFLAGLCRKRQVFAVGGMVNSRPDGLGSNDAVVISPEGARLACYTKIHSFTPADEHKRFASGQDIVTFDWSGCTVALFVCYDLRFPELFRAAVRRGAQLMVVIANWPGRRLDHWVTLLRARAIENQAFVAGVNRCGADPNHGYPGRSMIVDPHGQVVADAGDQEGCISAEIDLEALEQWRREFPALRDMRAKVTPGF